MSQQSSDSECEEQQPSSASGGPYDPHQRATDMCALRHVQRVPGGDADRPVNPAYWTCNRVITAWSGRHGCQQMELNPLPYKCRALPTGTLLCMALEILENVPEAQMCLRSLLSGGHAGPANANSDVVHWQHA